MNKKTTSGIRETRKYHVIDIENICGTSDLTEELVASVRSTYFSLIQPGENDLFIVASSHHNMQAVAFGWPGAQHAFKSGKDGADLILGEAIEDGCLASNFKAVYVASGDQFFANYVNQLVADMAFVTVVSLMRCLHPVMRGTGSDIIFLDSPHVLAA